MTEFPPTFASDPRCDEGRREFLLELYRQTSAHLGRHISGVWQCVGVVGAALIVFAQDKNASLNDYSCGLVVILCGWLAASTLDASNWFNRNLAIITNVERLFLSTHDLTLVHFFFEKHRPVGKHAKHFLIQLILSAAVLALVLGYHFAERVLPGFSLPWTCFEPVRTIPYVITLIVLIGLVLLALHYRRKETEFLERSPGFSS